MKKHHFSFVISLCVLSFSVLTIAGCNLFKSTGEESGELQPKPENVIPEAVDEAEVEMVIVLDIDNNSMYNPLVYESFVNWRRNDGKNNYSTQSERHES